MVEKTYWKRYKAIEEGYQHSTKGKKGQIDARKEGKVKLAEKKYIAKRKGLTTIKALKN